MPFRRPPTRPRRAGLAAILVAGAALASACTPVVRNHGYAPQPEALATIVPGIDNRSSVANKIGRPGMSGVFTQDGWYYVASTVEHVTYYAPEVVDRRVVAVTFDQNDIVTGVSEFGLDDGRVVALQPRTTPTHGRELTILQQIFGNLGVFQAGDFINQ